MDREAFIVTGSAGRIGKEIIKQLEKKGEVFGFDLASDFPVNLGSEESIQKGLDRIGQRKISSVIHLAAYYSFKEETSPLYDEITVRGTERLLKALQRFEVEQFIFTSTMLVHAPTKPGEAVSEESPVIPKWSYPQSKVKAEEKIRLCRGNIPTVILRIAGVYDDDCHSIPISHQIQRIYEKKLESHFFAGDLSHGSAFVHMDDLVNAMVLCVEKRKTLPVESVFLIGEEKTHSYDALQRKISQLLFGKEMRTFSIPKPLARFGAWLQGLLPFGKEPFIKPWMIALADDHYELNIQRAKKLLGWSPKKDLETTLKKMIHDLQKDEKAWYKKNGLQ